MYIYMHFYGHTKSHLLSEGMSKRTLETLNRNPCRLLSLRKNKLFRTLTGLVRLYLYPKYKKIGSK